MASRGRSAAVGTVVDAGDGELCGSGCREEMDCGRRDGERRLALGSGPPRIFERYRLSDASSEGLRLIRLPEGQEEMAFLVPRWSDLLWGEDPRRPLIMHLKGLDSLTGTGATRRVWTSDSEWGWSIVPLAGCRLVAVAGTKGRLRIRERGAGWSFSLSASGRLLVWDLGDPEDPRLLQDILVPFEVFAMIGGREGRWLVLTSPDRLEIWGVPPEK